MKCPKCEGKGFIEFEHGLVMVECDECGGTKEVEGETFVEVAAEANDFAFALMPRLEGETENWKVTYEVANDDDGIETVKVEEKVGTKRREPKPKQTREHKKKGKNA